MTEKEKFDVIIVGAGPAGCSTAIRLMQKDPSLNVALIDRGKPIGSKNISGGVIWGQNLATIIPKWWEKAPIERKIIQKREWVSLQRMIHLRLNYLFQNGRKIHQTRLAFS
ncbi:MAG: FAD-dependent oxidoreductase [Candidatus Hodarchaeales archaeon]|jgi:electron transfer flavoprotein-quinone oxidoreductase